MTRVRLIHWNAKEAEERASNLELAGYELDYEPFAPKALKELGKNTPAAVVIDLSRLPSQGRDIAINIRHFKATRDIPIVFVGGDRWKVNHVKTHVPDALYTNYDKVPRSVERSDRPPAKSDGNPKKYIRTI